MLEERGPYVYAADTVKDSEGMIWSDDAADLTYRERRLRDSDSLITLRAGHPVVRQITQP